MNVAVLTTGFDASHVDVIALLRATESVGLLQQIIGRGLRVDEGKQDCLVLDYAGNIERHCPSGDIFDPLIEAHQDASGEQIEVVCAHGHRNLVTLSKDGEKHGVTEHGWLKDLRGQPVIDEWNKPVPGHHGRRCAHVDPRGKRCEFRWVSKTCKKCQHENDIAARFCAACQAELVDPNEKLALEKARLPPRKWMTEKVIWANPKEVHALNGRTHHMMIFKTPSRKFSVFLFPNSEWERARDQYRRVMDAHRHGRLREVTYKMDSRGYYKLKL